MSISPFLLQLLPNYRGETDRALSSRGPSPLTLPTTSKTRPVSARSSIREMQASHQDMNNHPPAYLRRSEVDSRTHHQAFEGYSVTHSGSALPYSPSPVTHDRSHIPTLEAHDQETALNCHQRTRDVIPDMSRSPVDPNEGMPPAMGPLEGTGMYTHDYIAGYERSTFANPKANYTVQGGYDEPSNARGAQTLSSTYASTSYGGPLMFDYSVNMSHRNNFGLDPSTTQGPAAFPQRGPLVGTTPVYGQQQSNHVLPSAGPRTGTPGMRGHAERLGGHDPGNRMVGDGSGLVGASRRPTRVQRSGCGGRTRADEAVRTQNYIIQRNPGGRRGSATQIPAGSIVTRGSSQLRPIPQTLYGCTSQQKSWNRQPPIEFGWVNLFNTTDLENLDILGRDEKVLNYKGVSGSILCRLKLPGGETGKWKIMTTNHKREREPITKEKLVLEIAKLVERHIEAIKAQPGCGGVALEKVVLAKLHHVSKASWQPELWFETATPGGNSS